MRRTFGLLAALLLLLAGVAAGWLIRPAAAGSGPQKFFAVLNSGQEVPPNTSPRFGVAFLTLDGRTLCYAISHDPLMTTETAAHVHSGLAGVDGPIEFLLPGTNPKNDCKETPLTDAQVKLLKTGRLYINSHGTGDPFVDGEIRGQILK
jgi:hypothetical protein